MRSRPPSAAPRRSATRPWCRARPAPCAHPPRAARAPSARARGWCSSWAFCQRIVTSSSSMRLASATASSACLATAPHSRAALLSATSRSSSRWARSAISSARSRWLSSRTLSSSCRAWLAAAAAVAACDSSSSRALRRRQRLVELGERRALRRRRLRRPAPGRRPGSGSPAVPCALAGEPGDSAAASVLHSPASEAARACAARQALRDLAGSLSIDHGANPLRSVALACRCERTHHRPGFKRHIIAHRARTSSQMSRAGCN